MSFELGVTPSGHLHCVMADDGSDAADAPQIASIAKAFTRGTAEGLFALAARKSGDGFPPSFVYWRAFAADYLQDRCHQTQTDPARPDSIEPLSEAGALSMLSSVPPMLGAEYLSVGALQEGGRLPGHSGARPGAAAWNCSATVPIVCREGGPMCVTDRFVILR